MQLASEWGRILRHAWSVRLIALAIAASLIEGAVSLAGELTGLPFWLHAVVVIIAPLVGMGALFARFLAQKEF